jgi:hypothetical protein
MFNEYWPNNNIYLSLLRHEGRLILLVPWNGFRNRTLLFSADLSIWLIRTFHHVLFQVISCSLSLDSIGGSYRRYPSFHVTIQHIVRAVFSHSSTSQAAFWYKYSCSAGRFKRNQSWSSIQVPSAFLKMPFTANRGLYSLAELCPASHLIGGGPVNKWSKPSRHFVHTLFPICAGHAQ